MKLDNLNHAQATLAFLLSRAFKELLAPKMLVIEHSFGDGLFCHEANWEPIAETEIEALFQLMHKWIASNHSLQMSTRKKSTVISEFKEMNSQSKVAIAKHWENDQIPIVEFESHWDYQTEPMITALSQLPIFQLRKYNDGFLMRLPTLMNPEKIETFRDHPKLFSIMEEHEQWGDILGVSTIRELNNHINTGNINELIWVAEGLHEKKISYIADALVRDFPKKRLVCIAGPSSSGKTTFGKRLRIQLRVNGYYAHHISMDDYFIDRSELPTDADGVKDFESIAGLDVDLLGSRLNKLLEGDQIPVREFKFDSGMGHDTANQMKLGDGDFILIEGIHGLNPIISDMIGTERLNKIYVSAITQMNVDANHRISTSENRLLRRLVRDHKFRGYSPEQTLSRWNSVRIGEETNIFPYQEEASFMFNSSLAYELPVLAKYVKPLLKNIDDLELKEKVNHLNTFLSFFEELEEKQVPGTSILREFIGDSEFKY
ncbi:uridine kinase [Candidatus Neomarinimicrobiota bacterium]